MVGTDIYEHCFALRKKLAVELRHPAMPWPLMRNADAIVTCNEVTSRHGTGVLVLRVFKDDSNIISLRCLDHYNAEQSFGKVRIRIDYTDIPPERHRAHALAHIAGSTVQRVLCIPYNAADVQTAIFLAREFSAPLMVWLMDDNTLTTGLIPEALMRELLTVARIRLTTHPEMRDAYEQHFGLKFFLLPAIVPTGLIPTLEPIPTPQGGGVAVGNVWSRKWFDLLRQTVRAANLQVDWYGDPYSGAVTGTPEEVAADGIRLRGLVDEPTLVERLRGCRWVLVPSGTLDARDDRRDLSGLSLPGRILFSVATAHVPVLVLGHPDTPAARFVQHFGVGIVSDYDGPAVAEAVRRIEDPVQQQQMRQRAHALAPQLADAGVAQWMWRSLALGAPADDRFERLWTVCA